MPADHFAALLYGDLQASPVLPEHSGLFAELRRRMSRGRDEVGREIEQRITCEPSEAYGYDGTAMEARIFADAAVCRVRGEPFSMPATTGVARPTVAGVLRFPGGGESGGTAAVRDWLDHFHSRSLTPDGPADADPRWGRAVAGWRQRFAARA